MIAPLVEDAGQIGAMKGLSAKAYRRPPNFEGTFQFGGARP